MRAIHIPLHALLAIGLCVWAPTLRAQSIAESPQLDAEWSDLQSPEDRPGFRAGPLWVRPGAALSVGYDSNVFAASSAREDDEVSVADARMQVANDPGDVAVGAEGFVRARRFLDLHDQDTTEYGAVAKTTAALGSRDALSGRVLGQRRFESRNDIETPAFREVSFYDDWRTDAAYQHSFNRVSLRTMLTARRLAFTDASQSYRDRSSYRGELQGDYDLRNGLSVRLSGYYTEDDYRHSSPLVASASTVGALAGGVLNITEVIDLELAAGYFERRFDGGLGSISGVTVRGRLTWQPTRLTSVQMKLSREDAPTRVIGAFGKVRSSASLELRHAYSSRLELHLNGDAIVDRFDIIQRTDRAFSAGAGAQWTLTRQVLAAVEYGYAGRRSGAPGEDFSRHLISVSIAGRF